VLIDLIMNEVIIDLNMPHQSMKNWIVGEVLCTHVLVPQTNAARRRHAELTKQGLDPHKLDCWIGHGLVFHFGARVRHCRLFLSTPGN
jgi:hypothetical protein